MMLRASLLSCAVLGLVCACAARPAVSPAAATAQTSMQRAAQAFARGDLATARRDYTSALLVYDSLGDTAARATVLLSLSRVASQAGRPAEALAMVEQVLADESSLSPATRITAHGRAAALQLGQADVAAADRQLALADTLCAGNCPDQGALTVLHARSALARQQPGPALKLATGALALPALQASSPPTLKPQASAERANALRVQAQAWLLSAQPQDAVGPAAAALDIDRALGLAERVLLDLRLLSQAHRASGSAELALHYDTLARRAQAAGQALRGDAQADQ